MQKSLKYFFLSLFLIESVPDLIHPRSEWMLLQRFVYKLLGVWVCLRLCVVRMSTVGL